MTKKGYFLLFIVSCLVLSICLFLQREPGYMDSDYYYGQGIQIARGNYLHENFIWNFLNIQPSIPNPSFTFWMPLTSILAAGGIGLFDTSEFLAARFFFVIFASFIPVFCAYFAEHFFPNKGAGVLVGGIAIFGGQYFSYYTITDSFIPYFILGGLVFWLISIRGPNNHKLFRKWFFLILGLLIGLMHLTRADGILWMVGGLSAVVLLETDGPKEKFVLYRISSIVKLSAGYLLIMLPWYTRNIREFSSLFPSGNSRNLWMTGYNDLVHYPADQITFERWIAGGWGSIIIDRLHSMGSNILTFISSGGFIFLIPFIIIGSWKKRKEPIVKLALIMLLVIFISMSIFFPYAGERGGFFHSMASVQIIFWSLIPVGFVSFINFGIKFRNWKFSKAWNGFGIIIIIGCVLFTGVTFYEKLVNGPEKQGNWNQSYSNYLSIDNVISTNFGDKTSIIMINNPPGYSLVTGRRSVAIPTGDPVSLNQVAEKYDVKFIAVDKYRLDISNILQNDKIVGVMWKKVFENSEFMLFQFGK